MNLKFTTLIGLIAVFSLAACKKDKSSTPEPEPDFVQVSQYIKKYKNGVIEVSKYPVDTTRTNSMMLDYFNFEKMQFIAADKAGTKDWDIVFRGKWLQFVFPNNGTADEESPWYGNDTDGKVTGFVKPFDEVLVAPNDSQYGGDDPNNLTFTADNAESRNVWAFWGYTVSNEAGQFSYAIPDANKTTVWKLDDGRHVKFQLINIYNNDPKDNSTASKRGYLSFRYFIAKSGSTDLKTK
nr:HmuY family protein [Pedobacter panaciterrae]